MLELLLSPEFCRELAIRELDAGAVEAAYDWELEMAAAGLVRDAKDFLDDRGVAYRVTPVNLGVFGIVQGGTTEEQNAWYEAVRAAVPDADEVLRRLVEKHDDGDDD